MPLDSGDGTTGDGIPSTLGSMDPPAVGVMGGEVCTALRLEALVTIG